MRQYKITDKMSTAFANGENAEQGNDKVTKLKALITYELYGHMIAMICPSARNECKNLMISLCGKNTYTTRNRINGIIQAMGLNARVFQKNFIPYIEENGKIREITNHGFHSVITKAEEV